MSTNAARIRECLADAARPMNAIEIAAETGLTHLQTKPALAAMFLVKKPPIEVASFVRKPGGKRYSYVLTDAGFEAQSPALSSEEIRENDRARRAAHKAEARELRVLLEKRLSRNRRSAIAWSARHLVGIPLDHAG